MGITDSFALCAQNDTPFCLSSTVRRVTIHFQSPPSLRAPKVCGNPFFLFRGLRILSRHALRMTRRSSLRVTLLSLQCRKKRAKGSAVVKSCSRSKQKQLLGTARVSKVRGNPFFFFSGLRILSRYALRMTRRSSLRVTLLSLQCRKKRAKGSAAVKSCSRSKRKQLLGTARVSKVRGNPFFLFRGLRILSRFALRMTHRFVFASAEGARQSAPPLKRLSHKAGE